MALICYKDRVPLAPTADGRYQCPECGRVHSKRYWRKRMPDAELRSKSRKRQKSAVPPPDITKLGPQFKTGLRKIMNRVLAAVRDRELVIEQLEALVADRRDGDQGNTRVDEFDSHSLEEISSLVLEVLLAQELARLYGVRSYATRHLLRNLIDRLLPPLRGRPAPPR